MLVWILIILGVVVLDQTTKILVMNFLDRENPLVLIEGVFRFQYKENAGAAFGMFSDHRWVFMIISTLGIIAMVVYLWKFKPKSKVACTALSMIIGGGIGNMIDRCFRTDVINGVERNYVFDFIDFCAFPNLWKWTFNVADAFVVVGAGILMVWCVYAFIKELKAEKLKKAQGEAVEGENVSSNENENGEPKTETNEIEESIEENIEETEEK